MTLYAAKFSCYTIYVNCMLLYPYYREGPRLKVFVRGDSGVDIVPSQKDDIVVLNLVDSLTWYKL